MVDIPKYDLVGGFNPTPLKTMSSSVGMMRFPTEGKEKTCSKAPTCKKITIQRRIWESPIAESTIARVSLEGESNLSPK